MNASARVAIVGLGGIFAGAPTLADFWSLIHTGQDACRDVPPGRWLIPADVAHDPRIQPDHVISRRGCFIEHFQLDLGGLDVDRKLLVGLDPLFHLALHAGRQAWQAGVTADLDRRRVGVILGNIALPTESVSALAWEILGRTFEEQLPGQVPAAATPRSPWNRYVTGLPAGILARALGLGGCCFTLDAACASSLYALKLAVDELLAGRADAMLAGGLCRPDSLYTQMGFSQLQALSPSGRCAPFDQAADGLIVGEGAGILLLKRLDDALEAGDHIHAVIAGIGLSNDADGKLLAPSSEGQLRALRQAYDTAGWQPSDVDLIECHATGTPVGDTIELTSLRNLWGSSWQVGQCVISSVKSNVGHTLTAAGSAGLLKVLLALQHRTLPPTANFHQAAAKVDLGPFRVLQRPEKWPEPASRPRRAAVNAFGFGGINAHVLLEEWPASPPATAASSNKSPAPRVAIVGVAAQFGPWQSLTSLRQRFLAGDRHQPLPPRRWWGVEQSHWFRREHQLVPGYYLDEVAIPADRFRVPPRELEESLPHQLLALQTAADAVANSRFRDDQRQRTGVFVGINLDLNTTNFQLRWALWQKIQEWGQELGLSREQAEDWLPALREAAGPALNANRTIGALGSIAASRIARALKIGGPSFTLSSEETAGLQALTTATQLLQQDEIDQAIVSAVDLAGDVRAVLAAQMALGRSIVPCDGAASLVLKRLEDAHHDGDQVYAVIDEIGTGSATLVDAEPDIGHAGAASGLASVIKACLMLYHGKLNGSARVNGNGVMGTIPLTLHEADHATSAEREQMTPAGRVIRVPVGGLPFQVPPPPSSTMTDSLQPLVAQLATTLEVRGQAHSAYLRFADRLTQVMSSQLATLAVVEDAVTLAEAPSSCWETPPAALDRDQCLEFAAGKIGAVLGPEFAAIDSYPSRVRLPDEPLMLVDRIVSVAGEPRSLSSGRVVTEHDVQADAWYLDAGRAPACISIEAGQADLFLSAYLGIDFQTRGEAVYRLLDAVVTFHRGLPKPGEVIRYDIQIERFFVHAGTHFFRFRFDGSIDGQPLLTMREGCAGFFNQAELLAGRGIVQTELDRQPQQGVQPPDWVELVPMEQESFTESQLAALRAGDVKGCFGDAFQHIQLAEPPLPAGRMKLIDRVPLLDPRGGRYGLGLIRGEADIHADDWFLTCHFVDDMVMPGTLMYECCLHTLRIFLLRLGWLPEADSAWEPVPGVASRLKCRGQVLPTTQRAVYEVAIKELGYRPEPYALADAVMYADGKPIVEVTDMTLQLTGTDLARLRQRWAVIAPRAVSAFCTNRQGQAPAEPGTTSRRPADGSAGASPSRNAARPRFDHQQILAFATGKPSTTFGEAYRVFDDGCFIARLPAPPYNFIHRVVELDAEPRQLKPGSQLVAEYDVAPADWYFAAERQQAMPFAVLLETALQPCGFLAAYMGAALTSSEDLHFRNLGGRGLVLQPARPDTGTLSTAVRVTQVSNVGGMIILNYDFQVSNGAEPVYRGDTYFGFFTKAALAQQVGIREAELQPIRAGQPRDFPSVAPFPDRMLRMIDRIDGYDPRGGPRGLGCIQGSKTIDPGEWFFQAHFYQDPVWPGSLGLEAFAQLLKFVALDRFREKAAGAFSLHSPTAHRWLYRGQVLPSHREVLVHAIITAVDEVQSAIRADGLLAVDGRVIYQMNDFTMQLCHTER